MEEEARVSRAAWAQSMDACDQVHSEGISLRTTVMGQQSKIAELQAADQPQDTDDRASEDTGDLLRILQSQLPEEARTVSRLVWTVATVQSVKKWHQEEGPRAMINEGVTAALAARDATRNGDDSHTSGTGVRRPVQWFKKMESVYSISNCTVACQVKFATCTLQGNALTWWNSHVKTTTHEAAHAMPWRTLKKMMTDK
ncbi:hypothetical protein Tco_1173534 [Tanacetum coccineum]